MKQWTDSFKTAALARIKEHEDFLSACGIAPVTGAEQEFYVAVPGSSPREKRKGYINEQVAAQDLRHSHSLKGIGGDGTEPGLHDAVIGKGTYWQGKVKKQPPSELTPHSIVRAIEQTRKRLESNAKKYTGDQGASIDYDGSQLNVANSALQTKLSLWGDNGLPLFRANKPDEREATSANAFTLQCADSLLDAQHALIATIMNSPHSFERFRRMADRTTPDRFSIGMDKRSGHSVLLHVTNLDNPNIKQANITTPSLYLENRLPGAAEAPSLVMLMTVGGVVQGVKQYMEDNAINSPEDMRAHILSSAMDVRQPTKFKSKFINGRLPTSMAEAYAITFHSPMAAEILGPELHLTFSKAYKQQSLAHQGGASLY